MIIIFSSLFSRLFPASFRKCLLDVLETKYNSSATSSIIGKIHTNIEINPLNPINNTLLIKFISSSNQEEIVLEKTFEVYFYKNY